MHPADDAIGVACWLLISASFCLFRRVPQFSGALLLILSVFLALAIAAPSSQPPARVVLAIGLIGYGLGLLFIRAMLLRSVSLSMLMASAHAGEDRFRESIASRLDDARRLGLATFDGSRYALTRFGRIVARLVEAAQRATRQG